jgi:transcriptional regulator with XRE-family HTH domain
VRRTTTAPAGLAAHRAARRTTIEAEARAAGVARQTWYRWEKGLTRPTEAQLAGVAKRWGVSVEALQRAPACEGAIGPVRALVEEHGAGPVREALDLVSGAGSGVL